MYLSNLKYHPLCNNTCAYSSLQMSGVPQNLKWNEKYKHTLISLPLLLQMKSFTHLFSQTKAKIYAEASKMKTYSLK